MTVDGCMLSDQNSKLIRFKYAVGSSISFIECFFVRSNLYIISAQIRSRLLDSRSALKNYQSILYMRNLILGICYIARTV